jgi:diguanylate cyclase (GGDEF)-like protein/PAS domain S-box-containing protein
MGHEIDEWALAAAAHCPDVLVVLDEGFHARWVSPSALDAFGYPPEDLVGFGIADIVAIDELGPVMNAIEESKRQIGVHQAIEVRLRDASGAFVATRVTTTTFPHDDETWWALSIRPVDNDDALRARRARLQNIAHETALACSELRSGEQSRLESMLATLGLLTDATAVGVYTEHADLAVRWSSPGAQVATPTTRVDELRRDGYTYRSVDDGDTVAIVEVGLLGGRQGGGVLTLTLTSADLWDDMNADLVGVIGGLVLAAHERCEIERTLSDRSRCDQLTGLLNSTATKDDLDRWLLGGTGELVAVVFGDLDGFKDLNDRFGHRRGDELLRSVADALTEAFAGTDTVLGRVGGDEFVIAKLLPAGRHGAELLERCRAVLRLACGRCEGIDISLGLAESTAGDTAIDLLHRADLAMYAEKRSRKPGPAPLGGHRAGGVGDRAFVMVDSGDAALSAPS